MAEPQTTNFDRQCLEALKTIGKTLGQMSLYKVGHPAVAATLALAQEQLGQALTQTPQGELAFSMDHDKLIANGRIVGTISQLPNSVAVLFNRFKLSSLTFKAGLENSELVAFCELAASRSDSPQAADPQGFLAERGVTRILFNEAVYSKVGAGGAPPSEGAPPAAGPAAGGGGVGAGAGEGGAAEVPAGPAPVPQAISQALEDKSLEATIAALINEAVPNPNDRKSVLERVLALLKQDIERRVEEVAKPLRREKTVLQHEQTRTTAVLQNMAEGVIVVDEQGKIMMMNPAAEHIYGTTLAQAAGKHLSEKAGEEHVVTLAEELQAPSPDKEANKQVQVQAAVDTRRTVQAAGAIVQNEAGKVVGMVSSLTDVSKHKELQRMQRDFIAHVTHELRAPLSSIRAALEILQGDVAAKMNDEDNRMLSTALKNSDRLADLINTILDFSKIESGQMEVFPKKTDAERLAREGLESLGPWATKKKVVLSLVLSPQLPPVAADPKRTVQVLINLLSNAIKFTPAGGRITVQAELAADSGERYVRFSVVDTGPGIAKAEQKKIFEKFVQIAAGELHVGGTGLGLAIAKALVQMQGGKLWVESEEGRGAAFRFTLPLYVEPKDVSEVAAKPAAAPLPWWKKLLGLKK